MEEEPDITPPPPPVGGKIYQVLIQIKMLLVAASTFPLKFLKQAY